jgi:hypothetical protein
MNYVMYDMTENSGGAVCGPWGAILKQFQLLDILVLVFGILAV